MIHMSQRRFTIITLIIVSLVTGIMLTGCVEVAPPSGQENASAYGLASNGGGDMKDLVEDSNQSSPDQAQTNGGPVTDPETSQTTSGAPEVNLPDVENGSVVKVAPREYEALQSDTPTSYLPYSRPVVTADRHFITIYEITNQTFAKNASAYAYDITTPPLYINLGFYPKMVTDTQEAYKRTGDKEGTIIYTKTRPSQDAWFEMRVYDLDSNQEILREGYGKIYAPTNKTAAIRRAGKFQFDFMGDAIAADIALKIPVNSSTFEAYTDVSSQIEGQKIKSGLLPPVFLQISDLGTGWQQTGELTHTASQYSSVFNQHSSGSKLTQEISKYSGTTEAAAGYSQTKNKNTGESQVASMAGDEGYNFESVMKTGVAFRQGLYVVQLTSYSVPPISLSELNRYATIISGRINLV